MRAECLLGFPAVRLTGQAAMISRALLPGDGCVGVRSVGTEDLDELVGDCFSPRLS